MNDGAAAYRDLSLRSNENTYDFLMRAWKLFSDIKKMERAQGMPGARVVLATGFRMRGRRAGIDASARHFSSIMRRYQNGKISADQAIREAARIRQPFDIIPQLQANFAFSKAYVAESSGTKGGLKGANFFVDLTIFSPSIPPWVLIGDRVRWSNERLKMKAEFAQILAFPPYKHVGGPAGIRNGLEIAQHLAHDSNVLRALRCSRKNTSRERPLA
jgi:hypothetical protein